MVCSFYSYFWTRYRVNKYKTMEILGDRIKEAVEIFKLKKWASKWAVQTMYERGQSSNEGPKSTKVTCTFIEQIPWIPILYYSFLGWGEWDINPICGWEFDHKSACWSKTALLRSRPATELVLALGCSLLTCISTYSCLFICWTNMPPRLSCCCCKS